MADAKSTDAFGPFALLPRDFPVPSLAGGAGALLELQRDWLMAVEEATTGFLDRRRAALQQAIDLLEHAPDCRSLDDVLGLQRKLLAGSLQYAVEELGACAETAMALSRLGARHAEEGGRTVLSGAAAQGAPEKSQPQKVKVV